MIKFSMGPKWASEDAIKVTKTNSPKAKIHLEIRAGKKVTVITGLHTFGTDRLNDIAKELKTNCGTGGTVKNGNIEIQGDKKTQIQFWLTKNL